MSKYIQQVRQLLTLLLALHGSYLITCRAESIKLLFKANT